MQLIDSHFHLDFYPNHKSNYDIINFLKQMTICVTNSPEVYYSCKKIYSETPYVKFALGYNPQIVCETSFNERLFMYELNTTNHIGEVGLDFSKKFLDYRKKQMDIFDFICDKSAKFGKVLNVHTKHAEEETLYILEKNDVKKAIIHWYSGDLHTLKKLLNRGYYFSINPQMCMSVKGKDLIQHIPINRILIESDGPFSKINSKKFNPNLLADVYSIIANTIGVENFEAKVLSNFNNLLLF